MKYMQIFLQVYPELVEVWKKEEDQVEDRHILVRLELGGIN